MSAVIARLRNTVKQNWESAAVVAQKSVVYTCMGVLSVFALTACTPATEQQRNLSAAISHFSDQKYPEFKYTFVNLNNDGVDDAIVLLQGSSWCAADGCVMLVMRGVGTGFRVISKSKATLENIRLTAAHSNGWLDIIVHSDGAERLLQFDGMNYPSDPSILPAASQEQVDAAQIVLPRGQ
ncbi:hypothetical protein FXF61_02185 [Pseudomonas sp. C27(2019)]|uniref:hypothetical protein n=1 Tax=Pseudomonas sp. C27(2019) TaxID=2604941 RepID=UPI001243CD97|nr:hypothetical protein [Pseudomonas sp. C27(2019)]QEY58061.1 hypothetical protein FXF61_02185 [Pseudomonas sp. C27(2019)]